MSFVLLLDLVYIWRLPWGLIAHLEASNDQQYMEIHKALPDERCRERKRLIKRRT